MEARTSLYGQNKAFCGVLLSFVVNYKTNRKQGVKSNDLHKWKYRSLFGETETSSRAVSCCMEVALFVFMYGMMQHKRNVG